MKRRIPEVSLILVLGALTMSACALTQGERINPVERAGLRDTVEIELMELNTWGSGDEPYVHRLTVTDAEAVDALVSALDASLRVALKVACIPEYELHFHLADGTVQGFGYSCDGATFIRGEQDFWEEEDYHPPDQFDALIRQHLAATVPSEVNIVVEADLTHAVSLEVFETVTEAVSSEEEGKPAVVKAQVLHRLTVTDPEIVARVVSTLDKALPLGPRAQVPTPFVLQFHLQDGTMKSLGYASGGQNPAILRVDQLRYIRTMDAEPPAEFEALIEELLAAEADAQ